MAGEEIITANNRYAFWWRRGSGPGVRRVRDHPSVLVLPPRLRREPIGGAIRRRSAGRRRPRPLRRVPPVRRREIVARPRRRNRWRDCGGAPSLGVCGGGGEPAWVG